jgi:uncharacterized membrane protein YraQ (UPF0718 family)
VVLMIYGLTAVVDSELALRALAGFTQLLDKVLPALALVFVLIFAINLLLDPQRVRKYLGKQSGIKGWLTAIVAGILSTGPVYAWYAVLRDLRQKGMRTSLVAVLLYSRAVKLPLLPLLVHYFGLNYTLVLVLYLIGFSVISGLIMEKIEGVRAVPD